jgi:magnesium transporter
MLKDILLPEIIELIENHKWSELREGLSSWHPSEVAELLMSIHKEERVLVYRALPRDFAADIFAEYDYEQREHLLNDLTDRETKNLLEDLSPDDRTDLLAELPAKATKTLLNLLSPEDLKEARKLLGYPEDSVGRLMTPDFVNIKEDWTVEEALDHIRKFGRDSETIYRLYVLDNNGKLIDDLLLKNLILANTGRRVSELMDYNVISISAFEDQEEAVRYMEKYDISALPVVDSKGVLVGIVTFDDILDISTEEATEDIQRLGGVNPVDSSYLSAGSFKLISKRFPWLLILVLVNFVSAAVIDFYKDITLQVVALASFIPLLIGTAGNSGTQSATLIIRSLAVGEIDVSDWFKIMIKELLIGILLGAIFGVISYIVGLFNSDSSLNIPIVISLSMIVLIIWANLIGSLLPIALAKLKLDPAVISSPLIATLIDVSGIFIYYNIAILLLNL